MKIAVVFVCLCLALASAQRFRREEKYDTKYDNVNLDEILKSERLLKNYVNCLLDKGKCTPDASELKRVLPDALETACEKCHENQKNAAEKVIKHLIEHQPEMFKELEAKYDPKGTYRERYEAEAKEAGIDLPKK